MSQAPKLISTQISLHITEKKYACTHMLRSVRAHPRCISHISSAHACTSLEARVYAHRADRALPIPAPFEGAGIPAPFF
jgi:hypothetical protein